MKNKIILLALLLPLFLNAQRVTDYTKYVNPFIGTQTDETGALSGSTFPGATMPQGMVQLSPETELILSLAWMLLLQALHNFLNVHGI